ncbi:MAG: sulfotransferase [Alcanivoracaceae bacterium]|nr:sulfotransferase [Alcanivoracaceae bacterium]
MSQQNLLDDAQAALGQGNLEQAAELLKEASSADPLNLELLQQRAVVQLQRGDTDSALTLFRRILDIDGMQLSPWLNIGNIRLATGKLQEAVQAFEMAIKIDANNALAYHGIGRALAHANEPARALPFLLKGAELDRARADFQVWAGRVALMLGDYQKAWTLYSRADAGSDPDMGVRLEMALAAEKTHRLEQALAIVDSVSGEAAYERACRQKLSILSAMGDSRKVLEALEAFGEPVSVNQKAEWLSVKAVSLNYLGEKDEAIRTIKESLALNDNYPNAWQSRVFMDAGSVSDDELARMEALIDSQETYGKALLSFAIAEALEKRGDLAGEISWLHKGNAFQHQIAAYNHNGMEAAKNEMKRRFPDADSVVHSPEQAPTDYAPIFILGMPRSGTTLTEQILASHSAVKAGGENRAISVSSENAKKILAVGTEDAMFNLPRDQWVPVMRKAFLDFLADSDLDSGVVTDKNISLFRHVGMLKMLFPRARFVVVRRHPLDIMLGAYKRIFNTGQHFTYHLDDLAQQLAHFDELVEHWQTACGIPMYEMRYETLVQEQERVTRELLDFCELPFEAACLEFHKNTRQVNTASVNQVRQGLFTSASARYKRYGDLLDPFREALAKRQVAVPEE